MYRLRANLERVPDPAAPDAAAGPLVTIEAAAETYDEAYAQLEARLPEGHRIGGLLPDYDRVLDHLHGRGPHR